MEPEARLDTVGIAFPIAALPDADLMVRAGWDVRSLSAVKGGSGEVVAGSGLFGVGGYHARYSRPLDGGGFVAVGKGEMAWVEASLPKRQGQWESLTLRAALAEISAMVEDACQFVTPTDDGRAVPDSHGRPEHVVRVDDPKVVRLDLVREFRLHTPELLSPILDGLANVHHPGRMTTRRFADGNTGRAETLSIGPRAWKMTLYDKHTETKSWATDSTNLRLLPAPLGSLRAEARLHGDQLRSRRARDAGGTVGRVSDLEEAKLRSLRRAWWDLTGCGARITTRQSITALVLSQPWTAPVQARFGWWLQNPEVRYERHLEADCRRRAEGLGVVRGEERDLDVRLDYDAGHEIVQAA